MTSPSDWHPKPGKQDCYTTGIDTTDPRFRAAVEKIVRKYEETDADLAAGEAWRARHDVEGDWHG